MNFRITSGQYRRRYCYYTIGKQMGTRKETLASWQYDDQVRKPRSGWKLRGTFMLRNNAMESLQVGTSGCRFIEGK